MINFVPYDKASAFYVTDTASSADGIFLAYLLIRSPGEAPSEISINASWNDYVGYYLFLHQQPKAEKMKAFIDDVTGHFKLNHAQQTHTGFSWIDDSGPELTYTTVNTLISNQNTNEVLIEQDMLFSFNNYTFPLKQSAPVSFNIDIADQSITSFSFEYPPYPGAQQPKKNSAVQLSLTGKSRGLLSGEVTLADLSDNENTGWNAAIYYTLNYKGTDIAQRFPVFAPQSGGLQMLFNFSFDPVDQLNEQRSYLAFTGTSFFLKKDSEGKWYIELNKQNELISYFRTVYGKNISLIPLTTGDNPARLVFEALPPLGDEKAKYYLAPSGDFEIVIPGNSANDIALQSQLICGFSGVESFGFTPKTATSPGDVLRFEARNHAYAAKYPIITEETDQHDMSVKALAQATDKLFNLTAADLKSEQSALLKANYKTSWVNIRPNPKSANTADQSKIAPTYYSQPENAALYDCGSILADIGLPLHNTPAASFTRAITQAVPLLPYAGVAINPMLDAKDLRIFETQIIVPTRRDVISSMTPNLVGETIANPDIITTTSPQGLMVKVYKFQILWDSILLAKTDGGELSFTNGVTKELRDAFQSNDLFLVVTAPEKIGTFNNQITIADWPFNINIGSKTDDGRYKNILIIKFGSGTIAERLGHPETWTNAAVFNNNEQDLVAQQIQLFVQQTELSALDDTCYNNFLQIVKNPGWSGVLALQVDISIKNFPNDLKGLLAGIDRDEFFAHHMGVELNYVKPGAKGTITLPNSSMFGLINYVDRGYNNSKQFKADFETASAKEITDPTPSELYDFKVLTMQLIFENSAIANFASKIQLTATNWFDEYATVADGEKGPLKLQTIDFDGAYEKHDGINTYIFLTQPSQIYKFDLKSQVINSIEIVKAQFNTLHVNNKPSLFATGKEIETVNSRFSFSGYIDFKQQDGFDLFSFGSTDGKEETNSGLYFANLAVDMNFVLDNETGIASGRAFIFDSEKISFDISQSKPRAQSLFSKFPVKISGLTFSKNADSNPSSQGFLPVIIQSSTPFEAEALTEKIYSLIFNLNMGSMGALAAKAGFVSQIAASWSPDPEAKRIAASIKLPGSGGGQKSMSLQSVLMLNVDKIELSAAMSDDTEPTINYLLNLNNITLSAFSKKLPGAGNLKLLLFGDTEGKENNTLAWFGHYYNKPKQHYSPTPSESSTITSI